MIRSNDNLGLIVMENCKNLGSSVDAHLKRIRGSQNTYQIHCETPRFNDGEGKAAEIDTDKIRGTDLYILCDTHNHGMTFPMYDEIHHMSPVEHFEDLKSIIAVAKRARANQISVIMPLLHNARQHRFREGESLNCAMSLQELIHLGVNEIITAEIHNYDVQNAIFLYPITSFSPISILLKAYLNQYRLDLQNTKIISPDDGAIKRASFLANSLDISYDSFKKVRSKDCLRGGMNPILSDNYLGNGVEGMDVIVVDDMIASGESLLRVANELRYQQGAQHVDIFAPFTLFTKGYQKFDKAYTDGLFRSLFTTNLTYAQEEVLKMPWYHQVDSSKMIAELIHRMNTNQPISPLLNDTSVAEEYRRTRKIAN